MPEPSVEPMPLPPSELRFVVPLEAQEASYLAASARIASLWSSCIEGGCTPGRARDETVRIYSPVLPSVEQGIAQERSKMRPAFSLSDALSVGGWSGGRALTSSGVNTTGEPSSLPVAGEDSLADSASLSVFGAGCGGASSGTFSP